MRAQPRARVLLASAVAAVLGASFAFGAGDVRVSGHWTLTGQSSSRGAYHGTVDAAEGADGEVKLAFHLTYDATGATVDLNGTGTRQGHKVEYEVPLGPGINGKLGQVVGADGGDAGKITGTMWLTASQKDLWTHWSSTDGSTGQDRLKLASATSEPLDEPSTGTPSTGTGTPNTGTGTGTPSPSTSTPGTSTPGTSTPGTGTGTPTTGTTTPVRPTLPPERPPVTPIPIQPVPNANLITLVDGNGQDVPAAKKATDGVILPLDLDEGDAHHLLPVRLAPPAGMPSGATFSLAPSSNVRLWLDAQKTRPAPAQLPATATTLYAEGVKTSAQESIAAQVVSGGKPIAKDSAKVEVARAAFLILGHGSGGCYRLDDYVASHKIDGRTSPAILVGKDEKGARATWAVYVFHSKKGAQLALSTDDAMVAYDGHSNFGLGYAFQTGYKRLSDFMLISAPQIPVNWVYLRDEQGHPDLMFDESEYGDDASTPAFADPVEIPTTFTGAHGSYTSHVFPLSGGADKGGTRHPLVRGAKRFQDYHYAVGGDMTDTRIVIKSGSRDMPAKRWNKLFLRSCYSGSYYKDSFGGRGSLFFTLDESYSTDLSSVFTIACIEGVSNEETCKRLNAVENIIDYTESR